MYFNDLSLAQILNSIIIFFLIFLSVFVGGFIRNQYKIVNGKADKYKLSYLFTISFPLALFIFSIADVLVKKVSLPMFIFICFLIGTSSNMFIDYFFDGRLLRILIKILFKFKQDTVDIVANTIVEDEENKKNK